MEVNLNIGGGSLKISVDAAITSFLSGLGSISLLKEAQRMTLNAFLAGNNVFALLSSGFGKSLIHQVAPFVIGFVDLIGRSQPQ